MNAEIIAIGSEMLTPHRQDTNSLYLTDRLNSLGVTVDFKTIVGDNFAHLTGAIDTALSRVDIVILSGGLGPTEDDLTREAVASVLKLNLKRSNELLAGLHARFAKRNMTMSPNNAKQADVIDGAVVLPNAHGSAAGQFLDTVYGDHRKLIVLLPGPPKELKPLYDTEVRPRLHAILPPRFIAKRMLRIALVPESTVDARTAPIYKTYEDVETTILAHNGEIQLHFQCANSSMEQAQARVNEVASRCEQEMADDVFSAHGESLEEVVQLLLQLKGVRLATAESCTGGWLAQRITSLPNSSRSFVGGAVAYSDDLKSTFAEVPPLLIRQYGAVSEQVARALAEGIRRKTGADLAIGITGIAGPGGGTEEKPVGLVYVALADAQGTAVKKLSLSGDRERIRWWTTQHALDMLRRKLM
ncbi:competence/damage-inducible protein A [Terriglobus tenax]|uniref:competence/damage-inducible protein A n=1 Tax=Terriglobus tenax TaxID=1111115 RepID=UPI0021DF6D0B|nr:competence/damage-inducible protein A [Terriglobus tenax]